MRSDQRSDGRNRPHQSIQVPRRLTNFGCTICCSCHGQQVHPSSRVVCRSIYEGEYVFPNVGGFLAIWLSGWLAGLYRCIHLQQGSCLAGGASCQLGAHAHKTVPLHQYWPVSQAKGMKKYWNSLADSKMRSDRSSHALNRPQQSIQDPR